MKNTIVVEINRPVEDVFKFTINPSNTPLWIESIVTERRSDEVVRVGTIYTNISVSDEKQQETRYKVIAYKPNELFQLQRIGDSYVCTYRYEAINRGFGTRLVYIEEVDINRTLADPLGPDSFDNLKRLLEMQNR